MNTQALAREISQMEADICFALSDATRVLILYALDEQPRNVAEIMHELQIPQSSTSRHLKILKERGLVTATRKGQTVHYEIADRRLIQALDILRAVLRDRIAHRASLMEEINS